MKRPERRPTIMTLEEVACFLRLNKSTVYRLARDGTLPAWKLGNVWRFKKEAIESWIVSSQRAQQKKSRGRTEAGMGRKAVIEPLPRKEPFIRFGRPIPDPQ